MKPEFNEDHTPLAYLITFRCYGTWLHGDDRGSVDRHHNSYGAPLIAPNGRWLQHSQSLLKQQPVKLSETQRLLVKAAIGHTCERRGWGLFSVNVRTNHVHVVVAAACGPSRVLNGLKSNATRELREAGNWRRAHSPWADGGSKRYLWTEDEIQNAIDYVELDQGDKLPILNDLF